jgi:hypothetical protein
VISFSAIRVLPILAVVVAAASFSARANAEHRPPGTAAESVKGAMTSGQHAFCKDPPKDLGRGDASRLCPLAKEIPGCEPLAAACDHVKLEKVPPKEEPSKVSPVLGKIAYAAVIGVLLVAAMLLLVPIVMAIIRSRRDRALADAEEQGDRKPLTTTPEPLAFSITDAERLLALANDHARRGEIKEALGTYLTACLRALDQRGFVRFARHRTNGEYVRTCTDAGARTELATVVREVEAAEFGGVLPSQDAVARVARSATALVRGIALGAALLTLLFVTGCGDAMPKKVEHDPAGIELFIDVARRQGLDADYLGGSLGSLPLPAEDDVAPLVIVDLSRTNLDEEARDHLVEWVEAGGVFVALAPTKDSASLVHSRRVVGTSRDVRVGLRDHYVGNVIDYPATIAEPRILELETRSNDVAHDDVPRGIPVVFAFADRRDPFATVEAIGSGAILTVASADMFTNVGMARDHNAAAVMAIIENAFSATRGGELDAPAYHERVIRIARPEDGFTPPQNPLTAMSHAGLGLGMWHALAAAIILFLAVGIRAARAVPAAPPARRAFAEHVEATGALYARAGAATHARSAFARFVDERVRARAQKGAPLDDDALLRVTGVNAQTYKDLVASDAGAAAEPAELERLRKLRRVLVAALSHEPLAPTKPTTRTEKDPS